MSAKWALLHNRIHSAIQYRLRHRFNGRFADLCRPASIAVLFTDHCTAKCVHCDIWKNLDRETTLTPDEWRTFFTDLRAWLGPVQVSVTGGEALMKAWTPEVVAHASSIGLLTEVLTHGYWEDQKKIERLALARPWKVTLSVDGIGEVHTLVRGRVGFWERTSRSIETLRRMRTEHNLSYMIRLKHVLMAQNIGEAVKVAEYANREGMEVCFQGVTQNYNTPENPDWFYDAPTFPKDVKPVVAQIRELMALRAKGWNIVNPDFEFEAMIAYFEDPAAHRAAAAGHTLKDTRRHCAALTNLEVRPDGTVYDCPQKPPVGDLRQHSIREIWNNRPKAWRSGCCLETRLTQNEKSSLIPAEYLITGKK